MQEGRGWWAGPGHQTDLCLALVGVLRPVPSGHGELAGAAPQA